MCRDTAREPRRAPRTTFRDPRVVARAMQGLRMNRKRKPQIYDLPRSKIQDSTDWVHKKTNPWSS